MALDLSLSADSGILGPFSINHLVSPSQPLSPSKWKSLQIHVYRKPRPIANSGSCQWRFLENDAVADILPIKDLFRLHLLTLACPPRNGAQRTFDICNLSIVAISMHVSTSFIGLSNLRERGGDCRYMELFAAWLKKTSNVARLLGSTGFITGANQSNTQLGNMSVYNK